jgi:hypothetical protein
LGCAFSAASQSTYPRAFLQVEDAARIRLRGEADTFTPNSRGLWDSWITNYRYLGARYGRIR